MQLPRVLHSRLVYDRQEADVSLLQREGRPAAPVPLALGEAAPAVRLASRLDPLPGRLAAHHRRPRAVHQLVLRSRVTLELRYCLQLVLRIRIIVVAHLLIFESLFRFRLIVICVC